jgi:putative transposase
VRIGRGGEVLGCAVGDSETQAFWTEFLRSLRDRGLTGVQLVIERQPPRPHQRRSTVVLQGAAWQRSSAHINLRREVPVGHLRRRERTLAA